MAELHCFDCSQELIGLYDFLAHSPKDSKKSDIDKVLKKGHLVLTNELEEFEQKN